MKKMNKKGFTIVELTIVIAVIAILAAVLIPTFSGIVTKAQMSSVQQEAAAIYKEAYALDMSDGNLDGLDNGETIKANKLTNGAAAVDEKQFAYSVNKTAGTFSFAYTNGKYVAKYDSSTQKWTTTEGKDLDVTAPTKQ